MIAWLSGSEVCGPKFIVPRHRRLTTRPSRPTCVYSTALLTPGPGRLLKLYVALTEATRIATTRAGRTLAVVQPRRALGGDAGSGHACPRGSGPRAVPHDDRLALL